MSTSASKKIVRLLESKKAGNLVAQKKNGSN